MQKEFRGKERNEDHALFILLRKRDKEAFSMIYQKYHRYLYSLALKYLKSVQWQKMPCSMCSLIWESTADIHIEINLKIISIQ